MVCGTPLLGHQIRRLSQATLIDEIWVLTTVEPQDEAIATFCAESGVPVFRGSENDVLQRVTEGLSRSEAHLHVEVTGDCPLIDPRIVDEFVDIQIQDYHEVDAVTSTLETTYPPGLEVFVYKEEVLRLVNGLVSPSDPLREHAGYNLTRFPEQVRIKSMSAPPEMHRPDIFLEVDTPEDFQVVSAVLEGLESLNGSFSTGDVLAFVDANTELTAINSHVHRRWKALRHD